MSLYCEYPGSDGNFEWYFYTPDDYTLYFGTRSTRCRSCNARITPFDIVTEYFRFRYPRTDVEERIYGESGEVELATWYHCERCSDIAFSLTELGFGFELSDSMDNLLQEYRQLVKEDR
jgi:hypothetical protein